MARRRPYTKLEKTGQYRPAHIRGRGDVAFKGFQCLNSDCQNYLFVETSETRKPDFRIECGACGFEMRAGGETKFFDYALADTVRGRVIESGEFVVLHDDYVDEALEFKYCLLCNTLKPVSFFDVHASRKSGRQGECRLCKAIYNGIKNQSRITDQHREAAQRRRLYKLLSGETAKIDSRAVFDRFSGKCFNCGTSLTYGPRGTGDYRLDHTRPARYLWPISTQTATLLCETCNNRKHDRWPSEFYSKAKLRALSRLTGIDYSLLAAKPCLNEDAVVEILKDVDSFIEQWIRYPDDIRKVRRLIREHNGIDLFEHATIVPPFLREPGEGQ